MKSIHEIQNLSAEDLRRIGEDTSIPVPEDLNVRLPQRRIYPWGIAAAVIIGLVGWGLLSWPQQPKDTFDDPLLAYAAVEQALHRMSGTIQTAAGQVEKTELVIDKVNYWK